MALTLKINMIEIARSINSDKRFLSAFIPYLNQPAVKEEFGQRYIDEILARLDRGIGKDGKLKSYSSAYKKSEAFGAYGKSNTVNLKLTGSMRASLDVVETNSTGVTLGFTNKTDEDKAIGHVNGRGNLPVRDFFGLPRKEEEQIMKDVVREFKDNNLDTLQFAEPINLVGLSVSQTVDIAEASLGVGLIDFFNEDFE